MKRKALLPGRRSRYVDLPRFLAWAPLPIYYSSIASAEIVAAPGAVFWGVSNLGTSSYVAAISFRTDALQPAVELSLQTMLGTVAWPTRSPRATRTFHRLITGRSCASRSGCRFPWSPQRAFHNDGTHAHHGGRRYPERGRPAGFFLPRRPRGGRRSSSLSFSHDIDASAGVSYLRSVIASPDGPVCTFTNAGDHWPSPRIHPFFLPRDRARPRQVFLPCRFPPLFRTRSSRSG